MVAKDFYLATAADIVADPSAPDAFVRGLRESKEWVWNNGVLAPAQIEALDEIARNAVVRNPAEAKRVDARVFEQFMRELTGSIIITR